MLIVGATSGAGKSTVVAGLCRALARRGHHVAPFKAQNMSNHAAVTADGGEVGRAQAQQADAARVALDRRMNPVLLKPSDDQRSHVVVLGDELDTTDARSYGMRTTALRAVVLDALDGLRREHEVVIAEGAGGAAEINLLDRDLVNLPLARAAGMPALLVVDIEMGGAFAAAHGTIDLLPPDLRDCLRGVIFNRFRGDPSLLESGCIELEKRNGVPVIGVLPHLGLTPLLGIEDSLDISARRTVPARSERPVRIAVIAVPRLANPSDIDPFLTEPDVTVSWATAPDGLADADLVVIPGSRSTVADLDWMHSVGLVAALRRIAANDRSVIVGVCAGFQMLGHSIEDTIESGRGQVDGIGLLDVCTRFERPKIVRRSRGQCGDEMVDGYQIRFGRPSVGSQPWMLIDGEAEGACTPNGSVRGTSLHGLFDTDSFRRALLAEVARRRGRSYRPAAMGYAVALDAQHEKLADWIDDHLDVDQIIGWVSESSAPGQGPGW